MAVMVLVDGKNFNNNNSGQFVLPHPYLTKNQHKIHQNLCHQPIPSQPFLGRPFDFTTFFTQAILNRAAPFLQPGCF